MIPAEFKSDVSKVWMQKSLIEMYTVVWQYEYQKFDYSGMRSLQELSHSCTGVENSLLSTNAFYQMFSFTSFLAFEADVCMKHF